MQEVPFTLTDVKQKLESIGYRPFQVDLIIKETIGDTASDNLSETERILISNALERYFSFADKYRYLRSTRTGTMEWRYST